MKYCVECGCALEIRACGEEGDVPYCPDCAAFRFPIFNTAVSCILLSPDRQQVLLIKQYGKPDYILVAGYVNKGESAEQTVLREVKEEIGLDVQALSYQRSEYFAKSNTLILNFVCTVNSLCLERTNHEIDLASWFSLAEAKIAIKPDSLAERFLLTALERIAAGDIKM